jgi:polar amino acid transport system permease protein
MDFAWSVVWSAFPPLLAGLVVSLAVAVTALTLSTIGGTTLAILQRAPQPLIMIPVRIYISFLRGTPLLILIFLIYYVLPLVAIDIHPVAAGILALALNSSAFVCEIVRGGLSAIAKGQFEASRALGIPAWIMWGRVILPQVGNVVLPPMLNEFTNVFKATPLVSVITVVEMMRVADKLINATFRPIEILTAAAIIYLAVNFSLSRLVRRLEQRSSMKLA